MSTATATKPRRPPTRLDYDPAAVRRYRIASGLSLTAAAERAGITRQMWSYLEGGSRNASAPVLARCAEALGVRTVDLMPTSGGES